MGTLPNDGGTGKLASQDQALLVRTDEHKDIRIDRPGGLAGNIEYIGRARFKGALTSEAVWQIQRVTFQGNQEIKEWATEALTEPDKSQSKGNFFGKYDQIWDDRATLFATAVTAASKKETLQFNETVGTSTISKPASAGKEIEEYSLRCASSNDLNDVIQFSVDGGSTFADLAPGEEHAFKPFDVTQIQIKSNVADTLFDLFINREKT